MSGFHVVAGSNAEFVRPEVRKLGFGDLVESLRLGLADFTENPSHYVFLCLVYPVAGLAMSAWLTGSAALSVIFPLVSGFALIGPVAAIGLYELSRRREAGLDASWRKALAVRHSPAIPSVAGMAVYLFALFGLWMLAANAIFAAHFGDPGMLQARTFLNEVLTTQAGHSLILWGCLTGFMFALLVLATTVVAFPLLIDRDVGAVAAIDTSVRVTLANPLVVAAWGVIVAALLVIGMAPLFAGLAVVLPVLGHATWHLYRRAVGD